MSVDALIKDLIQTATSGVTKLQTLNYIKTKYGLSEEDLAKVLAFCCLKTEPEIIDYDYFYNLPVTQKAQKIVYPFTQIYITENFFSEQECLDIMNEIDSGLRPSIVSNPEDAQILSEDRTSSSADLDYLKNSICSNADRKISDYLEIDPFLGEMLQAQKYNLGQYYRQHLDFFAPGSKEYEIYTEWMGQRTWTFMCYLNDVEEGGETSFKQLKLKIKPKRGTAVIWNNLYRNGTPNYKTVHEALPPVSGDKYVITKWFRSWSLI